jgi:hypothetical protein
MDLFLPGPGPLVVQPQLEILIVADVVPEEPDEPMVIMAPPVAGGA